MPPVRSQHSHSSPRTFPHHGAITLPVPTQSVQVLSQTAPTSMGRRRHPTSRAALREARTEPPPPYEARDPRNANNRSNAHQDGAPHRSSHQPPHRHRDPPRGHTDIPQGELPHGDLLPSDPPHPPPSSADHGDTPLPERRHAPQPEHRVSPRRDRYDQPLHGPPLGTPSDGGVSRLPASREPVPLTALPVPKPPPPLAGPAARMATSAPKEQVVKRKRKAKERPPMTQPPPLYPWPHASVKVGSSAHGCGLYAERDFERSDVIFAEAPFFQAPRTARTSELLRLALALHKHHLMRLLSWEAGSATGTPAISAVFGANAIPCIEEEPEDKEEALKAPAGVFRYASRINHSCAPNAGWLWCKDSKKLLIIAYRRIKVGDELTVRYRTPDVLRLPGAARRKEILEQSLFRCGCATCAQPSDARKRSDANRRRLGAIMAGWEKHGIDHAVGHAARAQTLADAEEAVELSRAEGLVGDLSTIWLQKFYVHAAHAEYDEAKRAAGYAYSSLARVRGRHAAQQHWIAAYARDPTAWGSYAICVPSQGA